MPNPPERMTWVTDNLGTKLISVVIAVVLWVIVLGSRNVEVTKEIPVELITPSELVPANDVPDRIAFRLSGPKAFLRTILDRHDDPIRVNLSGSKSGLVTYRFFSDNIRLPIGVKVQSINPSAILIKLEPIKHRDVPVQLQTLGILRDGLRLGKSPLKPAVVRIKGAESRVDSVTEVNTLPVDLSAIGQADEREVGLDIAHYGVKIDGPLPKLQIGLDGTAAVFRIKDVDIKVLSSYKSTVAEKNLSVVVRATSRDIKALDKSLVYAVIDLRGKPPGIYRETVHLSMPDTVTLVKAMPSTVTITLRR